MFVSEKVKSMINNGFIKCKNISGEEFEVPVERLSFRPSVYGIIFQDNKILLSKQWDGYDFPGGGIKIGETIDDALKREVKEETGFDIKIGKIATCENSFFKYKLKEKYVQSILVYYLCEIVGGEISLEFIAESEKEYVSLPEWINIGEIDKIKFYNSVDNVKVIKEAFIIYSCVESGLGERNYI